MQTPTIPTPGRDVEAWRQAPGWYAEGHSDFESVHVLLGHFLADRTSPDPLPDTSVTVENPRFEWGRGRPLEKVLDSPADLDRMLRNPLLFRNSIAIVEPWHHVGHNEQGEEVRASRNIAFVAQKVADCDSYLLPLWSSGPLPLDQVIPMISSGLAVVVEGGDPTVRDPSSFDGSRSTLTDLQQFTSRLLLARSPTSATSLFICLGHQLAAQSHISLIRKAVSAVQATPELPRDRQGVVLRLLKQACDRIAAVGEALEVRKGYGVVARGWEHPEFAVAGNEAREAGERRLQPYVTPANLDGHVPRELIIAHLVTADEYDGVIDTTLRYERDVFIAMFHSDEVNEEAMLFANWAYRLIHDSLAPCRQVVAGSGLSWLLQLPDALEILSSTAAEGQVVTECSATGIYYRDLETRTVRRSFTCQFHPELLSDLRVVGMRSAPSYAELKQDDGARLLARLLYEGMTE